MYAHIQVLKSNQKNLINFLSATLSKFFQKLIQKKIVHKTGLKFDILVYFKSFSRYILQIRKIVLSSQFCFSLIPVN